MTVKQFVSKEEAIELYNTLKKVNKQDVEKIADSPTESGTILLFSKIANASTENDFVTALTSGEIPLPVSCIDILIYSLSVNSFGSKRVADSLSIKRVVMEILPLGGLIAW